jgi:hypothetical protein
MRRAWLCTSGSGLADSKSTWAFEIRVGSLGTVISAGGMVARIVRRISSGRRWRSQPWSAPRLAVFRCYSGVGWDRAGALDSVRRASRHPIIDWSSCPAVERDPERVNGAWVFCGERVPVAVLFEDHAQVADFVA